MKEMSLGKAQTRIKAGVKQVQSLTGIKRTAVHLGVGFALGTIVDLIFQAIFIWILYPILKDPTTGKEPRLEGFTIFPNHFDENGTPFMHYDDLLLLIITIVMVASKKFWFVIGFGLGWYFSSYMGLYAALGLPEPPSA